MNFKYKNILLELYGCSINLNTLILMYNSQSINVMCRGSVVTFFVNTNLQIRVNDITLLRVFRSEISFFFSRKYFWSIGVYLYEKAYT